MPVVAGVGQEIAPREDGEVGMEAGTRKEEGTHPPPHLEAPQQAGTRCEEARQK